MNNQVRTITLFYAELWNERDNTRIDEILTKDVAFRGSLGDRKRGQERFLEYVDKVHTSLYNYTCTIQSCSEADGKVVALVEFSGLHKSEFLGVAATGRKLTWTGEATFTFFGTRIANIDVQGDLGILRRQMVQTET